MTPECSVTKQLPRACCWGQEGLLRASEKSVLTLKVSDTKVAPRWDQPLTLIPNAPSQPLEYPFLSRSKSLDFDHFYQNLQSRYYLLFHGSPLTPNGLYPPCKVSNKEGEGGSSHHVSRPLCPLGRHGGVTWALK